MPESSGDIHCVWEAHASLGEGLCWSERTKSLWWVDILQRKLFRYHPADRARSEWQFDEEISAVAERRNASGLMVTLRRGFALVDPAAPRVLPHYLHQPPEEPSGNRFNDGKCDSAGRFWGGTMDFACQARTGALYRYDPDGSCVRHDMGFAVTNGPTWSRDERTMYFNDTVERRILASDFDVVNGALSNQREWLRFASEDGFPDGMTTDAAGRLWIAHWGGACVSCHDPVSGAELSRIAMPTSHITNCAFGGADLRTLFVTSARFGLSTEQLAEQPLAGGLFAIELDAQGVPASMFGG